jgi:hypothetical protein
MPDPTTFLGGASLIGNIAEARGKQEAGKQQVKAADAALAEQRAARQSFEQRTDPFRTAGLSAANPLMALLGIGEQAPGFDQVGLDQINPLVSNIREQGFKDIQNTAAARGRLRSGGTLQDLTDYNTQIASTVVPQLQQQRFGQLYNLLTMGANTAAGQGSAGMSSANAISDLLGQRGAAKAGVKYAPYGAISNLTDDASGIYGLYNGGYFK